MLHCPVSEAALRNQIKQLLAVHITAAEITTKKASSDSGILPEFLPLPSKWELLKEHLSVSKFWPTSISGKASLFSHTRASLTWESVSHPAAHVPAWLLGRWPRGSSCSRPTLFQLQERPAEQLTLESREMSKLGVKFSTLYSL